MDHSSAMQRNSSEGRLAPGPCPARKPNPHRAHDASRSSARVTRTPDARKTGPVMCPLTGGQLRPWVRPGYTAALIHSTRRRRLVSRLWRVISPDELRAARVAAGLTQAQLARLVDVADGVRVASWERGRNVPHPTALARLAEVLGLDLGEARDLTVRGLRLREGLTVAELAAKVGVAASTVVRWENGTSVPRSRNLDRLAAVFGVSPEEIVSES